MITQQELAKILGVSQMTVSAILRGGTLAEKYRPELRQKVLETAAKLGYIRNEIALAVRNKHSNVLGFITQELSNGYSGLMMQGIVDAAAEHNHLVKAFSLFRGEEPTPEAFRIAGENIADQCIGQRVTGVICHDVVFSEFLDVIAKKLDDNGIPLLLANANPRKFPVCHRVYSDMTQGGKLLFDYLHELNHERFALVSSYGWSEHVRNMTESFVVHAELAGIPRENILIKVADGSIHFNDIEEELLAFKPTAICATSDFSALDIITSLINRGYKVPEDFSVIGYGNLHFGKICCPAITSLDDHLYHMGYRSAQLLFEHGCKKIKECRTELIPLSIVKRESCMMYNK
jgi:DNA-binding LacI/PurR family transcriptional regulator